MGKGGGGMISSFFLLRDMWNILLKATVGILEVLGFSNFNFLYETHYSSTKSTQCNVQMAT